MAGPGPALRLDCPDIHLWLCGIDSVADSDRFRRQVLSRYAQLEPQDWRFEIGEHGRPQVVNAPIPLDFNLSHSGDWLVCAVTGAAAVGVDIEYCKRRQNVMKLAERFFHPQEVAALQVMDAAEQVQRFYDYWTLKEASVKSLGQALPQALASSHFQLSQDETAGISIVDKSPQAGSSTHYRLLDPLPDYRLALCWRPAEQVAPRLRLFRQDASSAARELAIALRASSITAL